MCGGQSVFYAAEMWGSWAVIFQQIYNLHSTTDDVPSRAPYTRRVSPSRFLFTLRRCRGLAFSLFEDDR